MGQDLAPDAVQEARMKELHKRCKDCGDRFTALRFERERISPYGDLCRTERQRAQARSRTQAMRERQGMQPQDTLDDFAIREYTVAQTEDLYGLVSRRHRRGSLI